MYNVIILQPDAFGGSHRSILWERLLRNSSEDRIPNRRWRNVWTKCSDVRGLLALLALEGDWCIQSQKCEIVSNRPSGVRLWNFLEKERLMMKKEIFSLAHAMIRYSEEKQLTGRRGKSNPIVQFLLHPRQHEVYVLRSRTSNRNGYFFSVGPSIFKTLRKSISHRTPRDSKFADNSPYQWNFIEKIYSCNWRKNGVKFEVIKFGGKYS